MKKIILFLFVINLRALDVAGKMLEKMPIEVQELVFKNSCEIKENGDPSLFREIPIDYDDLGIPTIKVDYIGRRIAYIDDRSRSLFVYDISSGERLIKKELPDTYPDNIARAIAFSNNGKIIAIAKGDFLNLYDASNFQFIRHINVNAAKNGLESIAFDNSDKMVAVAVAII